MRHKLYLLSLGGFAIFASAVPASGGVVSYTNIDEFRAAAGDLVEIDFTVLPNGLPSADFGQTDLTPEFNYTDWGVTFSSPVPRLTILANQSGASLGAVSNKSSIRNWIEAEFDPPVFAIGFTTGGVFGPYLSVFDANRGLVGESRAINGFLGIVSDVPIDLAIIDENSNGVSIGSILFQPVPEPAAWLLLGAGAWLTFFPPWRHTSHVSAGWHACACKAKRVPV